MNKIQKHYRINIARVITPSVFKLLSISHNVYVYSEEVMGLSWYVYGKSPKDNVLVSHNRHSKAANNDLKSATKPKTICQSSLVSPKEQQKSTGFRQSMVKQLMEKF